MLKINVEQVQKIIQDVADETILPRLGKLQCHEIRFKSDDNPVTIVDEEAEKALSTRLLDLLPGSIVVGEEGFAQNEGVLASFSDESPVWILDPLDGTKAFIANLPYFGVIVALAKQNQTLAGWLYDPTSREFVTTELGGGAWHKGQRLSVMPAAGLGDMTGMLGAQLPGQLNCSSEQGARKPQLNRMLSACHDYARLLVNAPHFSGQVQQAHFYGLLTNCTPWDNCAGILAHTEAGGYTRHWDGADFCPGHYGRGILSAPDQDSWKILSEWVSQNCQLNGNPA